MTIFTADKPANALDVRSFDAQGNGTTDDWSALQSAINAAGAHPVTGSAGRTIRWSGSIHTEEVAS
jgi:polygalacturonase